MSEESIVLLAEIFALTVVLIVAYLVYSRLKVRFKFKDSELELQGMREDRTSGVVDDVQPRNSSLQSSVYTTIGGSVEGSTVVTGKESINVTVVKK